jgi:hypothetical protein
MSHSAVGATAKNMKRETPACLISDQRASLLFACSIFVSFKRFTSFEFLFTFITNAIASEVEQSQGQRQSESRETAEENPGRDRSPPAFQARAELSLSLIVTGQF